MQEWCCTLHPGGERAEHIRVVMRCVRAGQLDDARLQQIAADPNSDIWGAVARTELWRRMRLDKKGGIRP